MSWRKHFQVVNTERRLKQALAKVQQNNNSSDYNGALGSKYSSLLPEVYAGHPLRIERYNQYDQMDMDSEVNTALDIIANFCTQKDEDTGKIFGIDFDSPPSDTEVEILQTCLTQWSKINEFQKRFWRAFRSTLKYGDQFFIRDPETLKWYWVEQSNVEKIIVNEATGKEIEAYLIRNLNINSTNLSATQSQTYGNNIQGTGSNTLSQLNGVGTYQGVGGQGRTGPLGAPGARYGASGNQGLTAVDATHVIHLSLSEGLDANWPFGTSILEGIFKVFRQKELLEDAVVIYRIIRAPERRIFYIDVGAIPPHKAGAYLEKVKNEMHQKRIPNRNGGSASFTAADATYSPMSMIDDFYFAQCLDLDTGIILTDGRILTLNEIIQESEQGIVNYVFSKNKQTLENEVGEIIWAGKTRLNAELLEITLSNDNKVLATPDHRFVLVDGTEVEALYLDSDMSLMSIDDSPVNIKRVTKLSTKKDSGDITIRTPSSNHIFAIEAGIYVHNSSDGRGSKVDTLPGGECLALDTKIKLMNGKDATLSELIDDYNKGKQNWVFSTNPETGEVVPGPITWAGVTRKNTDVVRITFDNGETVTVTPDHKFPVFDRGYIEAQYLTTQDNLIPFHHKKIAKTPSRLDKIKNVRPKELYVYQNFSNIWLSNEQIYNEFMSEKDMDPEIKKGYVKTSRIHLPKRKRNRWNKFNYRMVDIMIELSKSCKDLFEIVAMLKKHDEFIDLFTNLNLSSKNEVYGGLKRRNIQCRNVCVILNNLGYAHYIDFKRNAHMHVRHITKVESLTEKQDTGTITVDGLDLCHSFHNFGLTAGVFTKNSLGQIDDLRYFTNKLIRGLRIPSSYLPTGPEDGQQTYNDGRAGTAYIQEYGFAQYCQRLQNLLEPTFDEEFKLFVKRRGFNIDSSLYTLRFTVPQHFSDYARVEKDAAMINVFTPLTDLPYFSKRWLMINKLGMTEEQVTENERMWREENPDAVNNSSADTSGGGAGGGSDQADLPGIESMGVRGGESDTSGMDTDDTDPSLDDPSTDSPISGYEGGGDTGDSNEV